MRVFRGDIYQSVLIATGVISALLFGIFFYRELFPEYKIYQDDYRELELFRATYSGQPIPPFSPGIKQIVMEREDKGPAEIDRCVSCHVALQFEHFSPTKIAVDINGAIRFDENGIPIKIPNEEYVFFKLDEKIKSLEQEGQNKEAKKLASLKTAYVGDQVYDVTKVLKMHPLIGKEVRPFEFHPMDDYGCIKCHNGNGRGLTTETAHGPIFDGSYATEFMGHKMQFLEKDKDHDPLFSKVFNHKPGHELLFMTTPLFVGGLIEAKCIQCHKPTSDAIAFSSTNAQFAIKNIISKAEEIKKSFESDLQALLSLIELETLLKKEPLQKVNLDLEKRQDNPAISDKERETLTSNMAVLRKFKTNKEAVDYIQKEILAIAGTNASLILKNQGSVDKLLTLLLKTPETGGTLATKARAYNLQEDLAKHARETQNSFQDALNDQSVISSMKSDIDELTATYQKGRDLYISQGCYACHRIAGVSRAGVGPELTKEGLKYPWFVKESIVWPQSDLKTSTMPNMRLDHEELEALTTYLLAQTGKRKSDSETGYKIQLQEWETGKKNPWENPIPPSKLNDLKFAMTVFATEGCASCHRLKGFESNVGFKSEKNDFADLWQEKEWFRSLFPETITGSALASVLESHNQEIDQKIVNDVRKNSILEEISKSHPGLIESFYSNFKFAARKKNEQPWHDQLHRVLMMFIQEYGLGRLIGPRPNWSGVFRSDEWLMEHFKNPNALVPRSIMPVLPFDDSKFFALTKMLDALGIQNRDHFKEIWDHFGFNPESAYKLLCSQCHGDFLQGNGPVSEWIYPVPKNLRNAIFLRNLTKEKAQESITHGVKGTPMPPWGEIGEGKKELVKTPVLTTKEIQQLVDWLFSSIPGSTVIKSIEEVPKWNYTPEKVIEDIRKEDLEVLKNQGETHSFRVDLEKEILYASVLSVDQIFDITPNPPNYIDKNRYTIKKKYYVQENIDNGHRLFDLNCAVCHGKDADGRGARAQMMVDAKPRMLTNLKWLAMHDDLYLLRAIKYGVPGTAMTPWGDVTSGLQRLQLVMYIRTLSDDSRLRENLSESVYKAFETKLLAIEQARSVLGAPLEEAKSRKKEWEKEQKSFKNIEKSISGEMEEGKKIDHLTLIDSKLLDLASLINEEKQEFFTTGVLLNTLTGDSPFLELYKKILSSYSQPLSFENDKLQLNNDLINIDNEKDQLIKGLQEKIAQINNEIGTLSDQEQITELKAKLKQYEKLINKISFLMAEREKRFQREQEDIILYNQENFSKEIKK